MNRTGQTTAAETGREPHRAAGAVLMVRPEAFNRNEVTRPTNRFQSAAAPSSGTDLAETAKKEFDALANALRLNGIAVEQFQGRTTSTLPDEVFPNNWISMHPDGTAVLYPLMAWNRRQERRRDILEIMQQQANGYRIDNLIDLSPLESRNVFLEGTGSMVFDHANRIAYAGLSPRTHVDGLKAFARATGYGVVTFDTADANGHSIYHTNVMMSLGEEFALVCLDAINSVTDRLRVETRLERSHREIIAVDVSQLRSFTGNLLQLRSGDGTIIVMSTQARAALRDEQFDALSRHGKPVCVDVRAIESYGGGSVRCMLAEILLPRKQSAPFPIPDADS